VNKVSTYGTDDMVSVKDMISLSGKAKATIEQMVRHFKMEAKAKLASGKRGRPQHLFARTAFDEAMAKFDTMPTKQVKTAKKSNLVKIGATILATPKVSLQDDNEDDEVDDASIFADLTDEGTGDPELDAIIAGVG
jgi:hypothetical protein